MERQIAERQYEYVLRKVIEAPESGYILRASNADFEDMAVTEDMRPVARLKAIIDPLELAVGQSFMREEIPPLFGTEFI